MRPEDTFFTAWRHLPVLAIQAAAVVAQDSRALGRNIQKLAGLPPDQLDESTLREIREHTLRVRSVGRVLLFLQRDEHVELPPEIEVTLRLFGSSRDMERLESMRNHRELQATLSPIIRKLRSLEQRPQELKVRVAYRPEEQFDFQRRAAEWFIEDRESLNFLRIQIYGQPGTLQLELLGRTRNQLSTGRAGPGGSWRFFFTSPPQKSR